MRTTLFTLLLVFCLRAGPLSAQFSNDRLASAGFGYSIIQEQLPEGYAYRPLTILPSATVWSHKKFSVYAEGQFTQAIIPTNFSAEYEFGANLGIRYRTFLRPGLHLSASLGSGPHFITVDTRRQANGFIFSDNLEVGLSQFLRSMGTILQIKGRFRHISNAGLKSPNGGIDNLFLVVGVAKNW